MYENERKEEKIKEIEKEKSKTTTNEQKWLEAKEILIKIN